MEQSTKISVDTITGLGIIANRAESFGKKARIMRIGPMANATVRLVVPVATINPVTSAGKRKRKRFNNFEKTASSVPAMRVMPRRRLKPPVLTARMEADRKEGPHTCGQRYPDPTGPLDRA